MTTTYDKVIQLANTLQAEGKYDSTYSAVLAIYQNLTGDTETKFDSTYSIVATIADGVESGDIDLGGGGDEEVKDYNTHKFYNANGELVEEWTLEETQSKTELPTLGGIGFSGWTLNFDGWNWDLEQLKSASCGQNIGAMYRPSDNKTHIIVDIAPENLYTVLFVQMLEGFEIDWGDGVIEDVDTINGYPQHTYTTAGQKQIKISGNWNPQWGVAPTYSQIWEGFPGWYYNGRIKTVISGDKLGMLNFGYCTNLEYLTFTGDIHVYDSSFYNFTETKSLKYLAIPKGITSYPSTSKSIEVISMPYGVTSVGNSIYRYYYSLKSINIPNSVVTINSNAFQYCFNLQFMNIPNSVTRIDSFMFQGCNSLKSIIIPDSITSINERMFSGCSSLQYVDIPDGVTELNSNVFSGCYSLKSVNIPNSVTSFSTYDFSECHKLTSITIPENVKMINNNMFDNCYALQSINIPDMVITIGSEVFRYCYSLQSITIPDSVTSIGNGAFNYCTSLKSINIPNNITSIKSSTFSNCISLQYITIPNSVISIGNSAFWYCKYITVDFSDNTQVPELSSTAAFDSTATILVPSALYDEWINATNWSSLASQIVAV